jgi:hypothetical protein
MQSSRQMCQRESQHIKVESWFVVFMSFHVPVDMQSPKPAGIQTAFIAIFRPNPRSSKVDPWLWPGSDALSPEVHWPGESWAITGLDAPHTGGAHVTSPKTCETWLIDVDWWWLEEVLATDILKMAGCLGLQPFGPDPQSEGWSQPIHSAGSTKPRVGYPLRPNGGQGSWPGSWKGWSRWRPCKWWVRNLRVQCTLQEELC